MYANILSLKVTYQMFDKQFVINDTDFRSYREHIAKHGLISEYNSTSDDLNCGFPITTETGKLQGIKPVVIHLFSFSIIFCFTIICTYSTN